MLVCLVSAGTAQAFISGVSIAGVSSEFDYPPADSRLAIYTIDGAGCYGADVLNDPCDNHDAHSLTPTYQAWLTNGAYDANPWVTYDLGAAYDVESMKVWNYNEAHQDNRNRGIARALVKFNPELRPTLKSAGLLKRDPRKKERCKYGLAKRRKRFQFSKR